MTAAGRRPACLTCIPCALAQARIASAWPRGAMFEAGFIRAVDFRWLRRDAFLDGVARLAVDSFGAGRVAIGVAAALPIGRVRLAVCLPALSEVSLAPKAARTVANASSSESWRVSTVTFMRCSWVGIAESQ